MNEEGSMNAEKANMLRLGRVEPLTKDIAMTPHVLEVNGIYLHYVTWGQFREPERAVLLVHGITASLQEWAELGPTLAAHGWYAIAPDLRGRGWSGKPSHGYGIPYHVNDLLALCDTLGLPSVRFIGHSLGALIGYFLAALHPHRLSRLVAVDAGGRAPACVLAMLRPALERLGRVSPSLDAYLQELRQSTSSVYPWNDFWEAYYRYDAEVHRDGTVTSRASKAAIEEEMAVNATLNTDVLLSAIKAPTLITRAGQGTLLPDCFVVPDDEAQRVLGLIKGSREVKIPDGNHFTIVLSKVFIGEVLAFLAAGKASATKQE